MVDQVAVALIEDKNMKHLGDITKINGGKIEPVHVITFGSPCQDLSIAGKQTGLAGERSGLFTEAVRIIKEMREATNGKYPAFAVWENVPGAFSSNKGEDFRTVLEEICRISDSTVSVPRPQKGKWNTVGNIVGNGWSAAWRVLDAQYWGVPQRRRRIYLVADFAGERAGEILFNPESVSGYFTQSGAKRQGFTANIENSVNPAIALAAGFTGRAGAKSGSIAYAEELAPTLKSQQDTHVICLQGNGIDRADTAGCNGKGWKYDIAYTLNTIDRHAVALFENHGQDSRITGPLNIAPTVSQKYGTGGNNTPLIASIDCRGGKESGDLSGTLQTNNSLNSVPPVRIGMTVRRLMPLECERLQGFPDGWTDIPNSRINGKVVKASDSARYRALGNSVAIPCVTYVLGNISRFLATGAALGSLFDGIGGFPLVWERLHGKGSARWASEIEPFPIAVTMYRFSG